MTAPHEQREFGPEANTPAGSDGASRPPLPEAPNTDDIGERVAAMVEADAPPQEIAREVEGEDPADAADALETLGPQESAEVLKRMEDQAAADALAHMDLPLAVTVVEDLPPAEAASLIALMDADDAADLLQALPKDEARAILAAMPRQKAALLTKLALYDPDTAAGLMNTEFIALPCDATVADATEIVRGHPEDLTYPQIYCVDDAMHLVGAIELRDLLVNPGHRRVREVMRRDVEAAQPGMDRAEVAHEFERYDYLTMPVVDSDQRLLGIVTIDDVVDIIRKEQTEEIYKQVGVGAHESVHDSLKTKLKGRFPWLMVNLLTSQAAAVVAFMYHNLTEQILALTALMGMIANQAGNAGQQSLAVTLRGLVLGQVHKGRSIQLLVREVALGAVAGVVIGGVLALLITVLGLLGMPHLDWRLGVIAGVSMAGAITMGCLAGAGMPMLLHDRGFDPARGSSIFLTMTTDTVSFATLLTLTYLLRQWLPQGG